MTLAGRFIRFGSGGGGIRAESEARLVSVCDVETEAMLAGLLRGKLSSGIGCNTKGKLQ